MHIVLTTASKGMGRSLETMLRGLVQVVDAPPYTTVGENPTWVQRHVLDYAAALESCYERRHAPYILHLEDDMLPAPNWWPELMDALKKLSEDLKSNESASKKNGGGADSGSGSDEGKKKKNDKEIDSDSATAGDAGDFLPKRKKQ